MDSKKLKWSIDLVMGIFFLTSFITGLVKFMVLLRWTGLNGIVIPYALISDIHDWSGVILGLCVFTHLFLNRQWIINMTRKIVHGYGMDP